MGITQLTQAQEVITFSEIKNEIEEVTVEGYEVKAEYNADAGMYVLNKPTYFEADNKQIMFVQSYLFKSKLPDETVSEIINTIVLENLNHLIKHFNKQYVKREGELIWDDYRDNSTLYLEIAKDEGVAIWYWKFD